MSVPTSVPHVEPARPGRRGGRALHVLLVVLGCAGQVVVLLATFLAGLGWGGVTYVAALLQAGAAFVLIAWIAGRRRLVVLVPVLSAALSVGLFVVGYAYEVSTGCSGDEKAAVGELAPPPGTTVEFRGEYVEGCLARTDMALSDEDIVEHYEAEFARLGWQETPGQLEAVHGTAAVKDGVQLTVEIDDAEGGEAGGGMLETEVGDPATATPCLVNRVGDDESLSRRPVSQVDPGQWMMFVSADDLPASVVVRDGSGTVVFDQRAQARPDSSAELEESLDDFGGVTTLVLEEGVHEVECRPHTGAATRVPLRVAWGSAGAAETPRSVVLRVYETLPVT